MNKQLKNKIPVNFIGLSGPINLLNELKNILLELNNLLHGINYWCSDNLVVFSKTIGFLDDENFISIVDKKIRHSDEKSLIWRTHILCFAGTNAMNLDGDFVECGVYMGYSVDVITDYLNFEKSGKSFYCYDLFEGKHYDGITNNEKPIDYIRKRFSNKKYVKIIQGNIVDNIDKNKPQKIAFLHIDLNSAIAEKITLEKLVPLVSIGGWVILDDYGWINYIEQKKVADAYFNKHGLFIAELPTGQGLVNISKIIQ